MSYYLLLFKVTDYFGFTVLLLTSFPTQMKDGIHLSLEQTKKNIKTKTKNRKKTCCYNHFKTRRNRKQTSKTVLHLKEVLLKQLCKTESDGTFVDIINSAAAMLKGSQHSEALMVMASKIGQQLYCMVSSIR